MAHQRGHRLAAHGCGPRVRVSLDYCIEPPGTRGHRASSRSRTTTPTTSSSGALTACAPRFYLGALAAAVAHGQRAGRRTSPGTASGSAAGMRALDRGSLQRRVLLPEGRVARPERSQPARDESRRRWPAPTRRRRACCWRRKDPSTSTARAACRTASSVRGWRRSAAFRCRSTRPRSPRTSRPCTDTTFSADLSEHANPQRPTYACGDEGGLLLCTWPRGAKPRVAVRVQRRGLDRHRVPGGVAPDDRGPRGAGPGDRARVPRALRRPRAQSRSTNTSAATGTREPCRRTRCCGALTRARYDAVTRTLHLHPMRAGDFRSFLSTATGYGTVGVRAESRSWT